MSPKSHVPFRLLEIEAIEFTIPGDIVPWARAGSKGKIRFTPRKQADYATAVKLICSVAMKGKPPLEGPIMLDLTATYPWPAAMSQKKHATPAAQWRTARPDIDNIAKLIGDALNRIAWADDSQIACSTLRKVYGDVPGLLVVVKYLNTVVTPDLIHHGKKVSPATLLAVQNSSGKWLRSPVKHRPI